jgi:hypothetical protein
MTKTVGTERKEMISNSSLNIYEDALLWIDWEFSLILTEFYFHLINVYIKVKENNTESSRATARVTLLVGNEGRSNIWYKR